MGNGLPPRLTAMIAAPATAGAAHSTAGSNIGPGVPVVIALAIAGVVTYVVRQRRRRPPGGGG
jgi:hypothetical protein